MLDPISDTILAAIHRGETIRSIAKLIGLRSPNAVFERIQVLEAFGYVTPPTAKGKTDRKLSTLGLRYMEAQGYIRS